MPKGRKAGAKTGTTNDFAANWIVGVTPQYATAVWLGDPRGGAQHPLTKVKAYETTATSPAPNWPARCGRTPWRASTRACRPSRCRRPIR